MGTVYAYTECLILIAPGKYLEKYGKYGKTFQITVVRFEKP